MAAEVGGELARRGRGRCLGRRGVGRKLTRWRRVRELARVRGRCVTAVGGRDALAAGTVVRAKTSMFGASVLRHLSSSQEGPNSRFSDSLEIPGVPG